MIIYDYKYKIDSLSQNYEEEPMVLYINDKKSLFSSYVRFKTDSLYLLDPKTDFSKGKITWKINKNYAVPNAVEESQFSSFYLFSFQDKYTLNWKLMDEKKTFLGYTLYKAETYFRGRIWEAWYCPEISFNDGPYKFRGLPGLIFEVYDTKKHYIFSLIKMYKTDINVFDLKSSIYIEKKQNISKKQYLKIKELDMKDPARGFKADVYNGKIVLKDRDPNEIIRGIEKKAAENRKKNNNPLELSPN